MFIGKRDFGSRMTICYDIIHQHFWYGEEMVMRNILTPTMKVA